jgi:hypothetical protein
MASAKIRYLLEVYDGRGALSRSIAFPPTANASIQHQSASQVSWTLGERPVKEHSGLREERVSFRGLSGWAHRLGSDRSGTRKFAGGPELAREFKAFLRKFEEDAAAAEAAGSPEPRLVLRAIDDGMAWDVDPATISLERDTTSANVMYSWSLELLCMGEAKAGKGGILDTISGWARSATEAVDAVAGYVARAEEELANINRTLDDLRGPVQAVGRIAMEAQAVAGQVDDLKAFPGKLLADVYQATEAATTAVFDTWDALGLDNAEDARPTRDSILEGLAEIRRTVAEALGSFGYGVAGGVDDDTPGAASMTAPTGGQVDTAPYTIRPNESLTDIAWRVLGDRARWVEIATASGMAAPDRKADGSPLEPGDVVQVPVTGVPSSASTFDGDPYGSDLFLVDGDLVALGDTDVVTVSGPDNVKQAFQLRLGTVQGESVWSDYGLPRLVGESGDATEAGFVASHASSQLGADPRVVAVRGVRVVEDGERLEVDAEVEVVGGSVQVLVPFVG